jgi:hypothetical protein
MLDGPKSVLPSTHILERSFFMHRLQNFRPRLILLYTFVFLVFAGPAATLQVHTTASADPALPTAGAVTASPIPFQQSCSTDDRNKPNIGGKFELVHLPLVPVHLSVLPDRRILFWGRDKAVDTNGNVKEVAGKSEAYVWNMADGSNKTDIAVFRPSEGKWYISNSSNGSPRVSTFGVSGDVPVPGDYDGDGKADLAVYRRSQGTWNILFSTSGTDISLPMGQFADIPAPGDYDGDGKTDSVLFRPSEGNWHIRFAGGGSQTKSFGLNGDVPAPGDYDRDRKTDFAVFRPSEGRWHILNSSTGLVRVITLGVSGDIPAPGDYNGDGRTEPTVFHPPNGLWSIHNLETGQTQSFGWGLSTDIVATGDYDGDGKTDVAGYRPSESSWYILKSSDGAPLVIQWGISGDIPAPKDYDGMLRVANSTTNLFCSGHSFLPDGRLFVSGGHLSPDFDAAGEHHTNIFDHKSNRWSRGPDMNAGRWYPYNVTLGTGETLIMGGTYWSNFPNTPPTFVDNLVPQVYTSSGTLRNLTPAASLTQDPFVHLTSDGKVFQAQSGFNNSVVDRGSRLLDPAANQGAGSWAPLPSTIFPHATGTSIIFDEGRKVLIAGGFNDTFTPTREAEVIDLKPPAGQPAWAPVASMNSLRTYHTATILPNGKVLVSGGVSCKGGNNIDCPDAAAMAPEMWDATAFNPSNPTAIPWCKMADQKEVRAYHSIAALLPDGRVLIGGGGLPGAVGESDANGKKILRTSDAHARFFGHKSVEVYSPPYLFKSDGSLAARPVITSAPQTVAHGQTFFVGTSGAGTSPQVSLVRLPSVTHGFNQDQRQLFLSATLSGSSGLNVTAPVDPNKCPPGYYMLFVLNAGVPSVSAIIKVEPASTLTATMTCDNGYEFYFNGSFKGSGAGWWQAQSYNLLMHSGKNVLAIKCTDAGGLAAFLAELKVNGVRIGSNTSWKVSRTAPSNWADVNFNDSSWANATDYGAYGIAPWHTNVSGIQADTPARWIWSSNNDLDDVVYIRISLESQNATALMTCDNAYDFYFNGNYRGSGSNWMQPQTYSLPVQTGKNVLAIKCTDTGSLAGFLAEVRVNGLILGSNTSWKVSRTAPANWADANFNDSGWVNASDLGFYGSWPWFTNVSGMPTDTPARWIWSSNNDLDDIVYIRGSFVR